MGGACCKEKKRKVHTIDLMSEASIKDFVQEKVKEEDTDRK